MKEREDKCAFAESFCIYTMLFVLQCDESCFDVFSISFLLKRFCGGVSLTSSSLRVSVTDFDRLWDQSLVVV